MNKLKKSRKIYFVDTGMRNAVINNLNAPDLRGDVGGLWENFVIAERMKRNHNQRLFPDCCFWRSHQKQEIDYLEELNGALRGYEINWRETRLKVPAGFIAAYPDCPVSLINPSTPSPPSTKRRRPASGPPFIGPTPGKRPTGGREGSPPFSGRRRSNYDAVQRLISQGRV